MKSSRKSKRPKARSSSPLVAGLAALTGMWILLAPKSAFAVEAGKKYMYRARLRPPLPASELPGLRSYVESFGNTVLDIGPSDVAYQVNRSSNGTVLRGKVLANFGGSNVVLDSVTPL